MLLTVSNAFVKAEHKAAWVISYMLSSELNETHMADTLLLNIVVLLPLKTVTKW